MGKETLGRVLRGILAATAIGTLAACTPYEGRVVIQNHATEPIERASVLICGQTQLFEAIDVQQAKSAKYRVTSDSHYRVRVEFRSGKTLERQLGYVTNGFDFDDVITVSDTGIEISSNQNTPPRSPQ